MRATFTELREGIRYVAGSTFLWVTIALAALTSIGGAGALQVSLPKLVLDGYGQGIWLLGIIWMAGGFGALLAIPLRTYLNRLRRPGLTIYLALVSTGMALIAFGLPLPRFVEPAVACIAMTIVSLGMTIGEVLFITVMQEIVPDDKLGRVSSINQLVAYGFWPLGFVLAGVITDRISPAWLFLGAGVLQVGCYGLALCMRSIRQASGTSPVILKDEQEEERDVQEALFPDWSLQPTSPLSQV